MCTQSYYTHILLVAGNHDYYLMNSKERYKLQTSMNRWVEMKALSSSIEGVHFLEGDSFEWDGVRYGGSCGHSFDSPRSMDMTKR